MASACKADLDTLDEEILMEDDSNFIMSPEDIKLLNGSFSEKQDSEETETEDEDPEQHKPNRIKINMRKPQEGRKTTRQAYKTFIDV